jgi:hypothetical protein
MFDSNEMQALGAVSRDRYQRNGGGGAHKIYASSKAWWDARGFADLSKLEQDVIAALYRYRQNCRLKEAYAALDLLTAAGGFFDGESIPF